MQMKKAGSVAYVRLPTPRMGKTPSGVSMVIARPSRTTFTERMWLRLPKPKPVRDSYACFSFVLYPPSVVTL
jgi:hypothetical protein